MSSFFAKGAAKDAVRRYGCSFELRIPRTRTGNFRPLILGILSSQESERTLLFHELYTRGLPCEDIGAVCERIYGHHYSKQQVSYISWTSKEKLSKWLSRKLSPRYIVVYIDTTFTPTR